MWKTARSQPDDVENPVDSRLMGARGLALGGRGSGPDADPPAERAPRVGRPGRWRRRARLPSTRGGLAWLAVLVIVGGFLAIQIGREVYANWAIRQRAAEIREEIAAVEAENERLEEELAYLRSDAFVSAEARRLTNLGLPGEQVLIIPPGREEPLPPELAPKPPPPKPLLQQWVELFFGV